MQQSFSDALRPAAFAERLPLAILSQPYQTAFTRWLRFITR